MPGVALATVVAPLLERFTARHPRVQVDVIVDSRLVDVVAERYDAGVRLMESTHRDMVTTRLSGPFRFVVVGSPGYLERRGAPKHPRELARHALIGFRSEATKALVPWDLEKRGRVWKVPTGGSFVTNHEGLLLEGAVRGLGLAYVAEFSAKDALAREELRIVLEDWATDVPGFFLVYPSRQQASANLRAFIACAKP